MCKVDNRNKVFFVHYCR